MVEAYLGSHGIVVADSQLVDGHCVILVHCEAAGALSEKSAASALYGATRRQYDVSSSAPRHLYGVSLGGAGDGRTDGDAVVIK